MGSLVVKIIFLNRMLYWPQFANMLTMILIPKGVVKIIYIYLEANYGQGIFNKRFSTT